VFGERVLPYTKRLRDEVQFSTGAIFRGGPRIISDKKKKGGKREMIVRQASEGRPRTGAAGIPREPR